MRFEALTDFDCAVTQSSYAAGMSYTIRPGNTGLFQRVAKWVEEGKVRLLGAAAPKSQVTGDGHIVSNTTTKG